tara:strand:- start:292 stop:513 length:222 start_codon:yes stop_codon:yes gene_type:complete
VSEDQKYPVEILKTKTVDELIEIIFSLQEEIAMLDFLINEYEEMQSALGKAMKEQLVEHYNKIVLSNTETGEA